MQKGADQPSARRRRLFVAAGAALGAGSLLASQEAKAGTFTAANIRDYYSGSWDAAFQSALATGNPIYFPPGDYIFQGELNVSYRDLVIFGDGPDVSRLTFPANSNGIVFTG